MSWNQQRDHAIETAKVMGLSIIESNDLTLQLDIDSEDDLKFAKTMIAMMKDHVPFTSATYTKSKSGNWHVYVHLKQPMPWEHRLLLQACLGSDRKREVLNFYYRKQGWTGDCLLFEKADAVQEELRLT